MPYMPASRKVKERGKSSFGQKIVPIIDWAVIAVVLIVAVFIIVGYLQPVVKKPVTPRIIDGRAFKVQLFGGCRRPDEVMKIAEQLRKIGIDVVEIKNESGFTYPKSLIVDRVGNKAVADSLAHLLGLPESRVIVQKYNLMLDATIVIGLDYPRIIQQLNG